MRRIRRLKSFRRLLGLAFACALIAASLCAGPTKAQAEPYAPTQTAAATQTAATTRAFADVSGMEWYAGAVYALASEGIVDRREDGSFGPDGNVTRAEMAVFLARALGLKESSGQPFFDVNTSDRFAGAVGALFQRGLIQGTSPIVFSPEQVVSRQEAVTLVMRSMAFLYRDNPQTAARLRLTEYLAPAWLAGFHDRQLIAPVSVVSAVTENASHPGDLDDPANGWFFARGRPDKSGDGGDAVPRIPPARRPEGHIPRELPGRVGLQLALGGFEGASGVVPGDPAHGSSYPCSQVDGVFDYRAQGRGDQALGEGRAAGAGTGKVECQGVQRAPFHAQPCRPAVRSGDKVQGRWHPAGAFYE